MVSGINLGKTSRPTSTLVYEACTKGKQYEAKLDNNAKMQVTKSLEIVHLGVYVVPWRTRPREGQKKVVTFVDDYSKKVWVYMMKYKGKWFERFKEFQAFVEMQSKHEIKEF